MKKLILILTTISMLFLSSCKVKEEESDQKGWGWVGTAGKMAGCAPAYLPIKAAFCKLIDVINPEHDQHWFTWKWKLQFQARYFAEALAATGLFAGGAAFLKFMKYLYSIVLDPSISAIWTQLGQLGVPAPKLPNFLNKQWIKDIAPLCVRSWIAAEGVLTTTRPFRGNYINEMAFFTDYCGNRVRK